MVGFAVGKGHLLWGMDFALDALCYGWWLVSFVVCGWWFVVGECCGL